MLYPSQCEGRDASWCTTIALGVRRLRGLSKAWMLQEIVSVKHCVCTSPAPEVAIQQARLTGCYAMMIVGLTQAGFRPGMEFVQCVLNAAACLCLIIAAG